jgi:hypothetical protein
MLCLLECYEEDRSRRKLISLQSIDLFFPPYFHSKCKQLVRAFSNTVYFLAAMLEKNKKYILRCFW